MKPGRRNTFTFGGSNTNCIDRHNTASPNNGSIMYAKRVLPLALLHAAGGHIEGKTRFQKLTFIADQRLEEIGIDPYEFIPYDYGPFSKDLYEVLEYLEEEGLIEINEKRTYGGDTRYDYHLSSYGRKNCDQNFPDLDDNSTTRIGQRKQKHEEKEDLWDLYQIATGVVDEYNSMPISNLIDEVYDEYPEYAENSVLN